MPTVDLNLGPNYGGANAANPLDSASTIVDMQSKFLQQQQARQAIQNYQLDMQAKSKAGEIIAHSPPGDYGAMVSNLQSDPLVAGRLPDIFNSINSARSAMLTGGSQLIDQNSKAMDIFNKIAASAANDPTQLASVKKQTLDLLPPDVRARVSPFIDDATDSLMTGVTGKDQASIDQFQHNYIARMVGSGTVTPDAGFAAMGRTPPATSVQPMGQGGAEIPVTLGGFGATSTANPTGAGASMPPPSGLSESQKAFQAKSGDVGGEIAGEISDNAATLPTALKRIDLMTQALGQFQSGGGADFRGEAGKLAQALKNAGVDIDDKTIQQIANGSLPAGQVFDSLVSRAGVQALKADAAGTGKVMRTEVDRYLEMMGKTNDPNTLLTLMNNLKYTMNVGYDQSQKFLQFKHLLAAKDPSVAGLDPGDFHSWYNHNFDPDKLETPKGMSASMAPTQPGAIKGTGTPSAVTHVYNPKTGKIEPIAPQGQ